MQFILRLEQFGNEYTRYKWYNNFKLKSNDKISDTFKNVRHQNYDFSVEIKAQPDFEVEVEQDPEPITPPEEEEDQYTLTVQGVIELVKRVLKIVKMKNMILLIRN